MYFIPASQYAVSTKTHACLLGTLWQTLCRMVVLGGRVHLRGQDDPFCAVPARHHSEQSVIHFDMCPSVMHRSKMQPERRRTR